MFTWQFFVTISMNDRNKTTHKFFFLVWCIGHSNFLTEICEILVCKLVFRINWHLVIADNLRHTRKCPKSMSDRNKLIPIKFLSNCNLLTQPLMYLYVWNIPRISFRATCSRSPPATPHRLLNPKWPMGSGNMSNPNNFC